MPRKKPEPRLDVKGKSIQEIGEISVYDFHNIKDLRNAVNRLASAGNKRLRRFEARGESSPATRYIEDSGGRFSSRGKNWNELMQEFVRARDFLNAKSGSLTEWMKIKRDTIDALSEKNINLSNDQWRDFWKSYEKIKQMDPRVKEKDFKYLALREVHRLQVENDNMLTPEDMASRITGDRLTELYEQAKQQEQEFNADVSDIFITSEEDIPF